MPRIPLPIDDVLNRIVTAAGGEACLIVEAPPGSGKTTRVPPALLDGGVAAGQILLLEPRRLAARAAAARMAQERGQEVGQDIGYQVRFERRAGPRTRILAVTPGILLRRLQDDPFLNGAGIVIFDEFHERGVDTDLTLGMLRLVQQSVRPDLKLIVMSATLASAAIRAYLGGCTIVRSEGRLFPVDIRYRPRVGQEPLTEAAARAVIDVIEETSGDILVFLPGMREIRQTARLLEASVKPETVVLPLHGDLSLEEQSAALAPAACRKVVLATNVAESSITVEGVVAVIDTGVARVLRLDRDLGLDRLELCPISQASASQRAGRAGRTQPGVCIRLWSEAWQRNLAEQTEPEIFRVDMVGALLHLLSLGEAAETFPWLDAPAVEQREQALATLRLLDAVDDSGKITDSGRLLARLPVHPRLARLLVEGARRGVLERAALAAALLSERDVFTHGSERRPRITPTRSDLLERVEALEASFRGQPAPTPFGAVERGTARFLQHAQRQLARMAREEGLESAPAADPDEALLRSLVTAFPDRVARRRAVGERRGLLVGGRGVVLGPGSGVLEGELFLALDVDAGGTEATVRLASAVQRDWLPAERMRSSIDVFFEAQTEKVVARKRLLYEDLMLEEGPAALPEDGRVQALLLEAALRQPSRVLPDAETPGGRFLTRVRWLARWMPELKLPSLDGTTLADVLRWLIAGRRSFAELRAAPWEDMILGNLTHAQRQALEREAPERLEVPSGSRIALRYSEDRPVLGVRIQEIFGWRETPRLAGGKVPVLLHLLAPNYRPQQITEDLASFWRNTYPVVRKELRARYPKHPWPEDPLSAAAIRK